ncbi:hypothetical protein OIU84_013840 [Salix udensis]|uniref:Uncharacterized protein n=1 Tax=Salix udensis TaxID=889485 RepID=A0AAD6JJ89_9ROSI|nr:hypothetical protein OIU84_013840 [Salix udensis]
MWSKVQDQLRRTSIDGVDKVASTTSSSLPFYLHLSDYLFEPHQQETLGETMGSLKFHHLLVDYFEASSKACHICDLLLQCTQQTREKRRVVRKAKFRRIFVRVGGGCLVISHTALLIALLVAAIHSMVGIVAAPGLMGCSLYVFRKQIKFVRRGSGTVLLEKRLGAQLDLAAKGIYILINDFNTMSRLTRSLFDEVEHQKALAGMCVRSNKPELLKEVVKEFHIQDSCYLERLEELERHIYLCFHTMNRFRRHVVEEIMVESNSSTADDHQREIHMMTRTILGQRRWQQAGDLWCYKYSTGSTWKLLGAQAGSPRLLFSNNVKTRHVQCQLLTLYSLNSISMDNPTSSMLY